MNDICNSIKQAFQPFKKLVDDINNHFNKNYAFFVLNKETGEYGHYTSEDTITLVKDYGEDNLIIFAREDQLKVTQNIIFSHDYEEKMEEESE